MTFDELFKEYKLVANAHIDVLKKYTTLLTAIAGLQKEYRDCNDGTDYWSGVKHSLDSILKDMN